MWLSKRFITSNALDQFNKLFGVAVIGGGHAGCEAALASSRMGVNTVLVTDKFQTIGEMSCNPSFGGVGKGHLMAEVDALDGVCSRICDKAGIHYRKLNASKGPAVWGPRAQIDRSLYKKFMHEEIKNAKNLTVICGKVHDLVFLNPFKPSVKPYKMKVTGIVMADGSVILCDAVVIATGTFLHGEIFVGLDKRGGGRINDDSSIGLAETIKRLGFRIGRLKTGTPPRLDRESIDFSRFEVQHADNPPTPFSFMNESVTIKPEDQLKCYLFYTPLSIVDIIKTNLHLGHHITATVKGPRYCPSLEAKILRFPDRNHPVWLEPEGLDSSVVYPQGLSCSLPVEVQQQVLHSIPGLENVKITQPGYRVEYDFVNPQDLYHTLETRIVENLYFAGQINGTTGYEEAAAQGIVAGINAACKLQNKEEFIVSRYDGYIGVVIDDIITDGVVEPYRMFSSRSEYRITQRTDNADLRLTEKGYNVGVVGKERYETFLAMKSKYINAVEFLKSVTYNPFKWNELTGFSPKGEVRAFDLIRYPQFDIARLKPIIPKELDYILADKRLQVRLFAESLYEHEIQFQRMEIECILKQTSFQIPSDLNYDDLNLSNESKEILKAARPLTIGDACKIPGLTPASLALFFRFVRKLNARKTG